MISVVIATRDNERTLAAVLGALVPAAVESLVREVIVVDAGSGDRTLQIADDAGARILKGAEITPACQMAKGDWLLILDAKTPPPPGWEAVVLDHIREHAGETGWWAKPARWPWIVGSKPLGLLIPKRLCEPGFSGAPGRRARRLRFDRR
jgi:glycosyltransferase involved in cell wall biosynthesis